MNGLEALFWSLVYEAFNSLFRRSRRFEHDCPHCERTHSARSWNMALLKSDLHAHMSEDHPDTDSEADVEWPDPRQVAPPKEGSS